MRVIKKNMKKQNKNILILIFILIYLSLILVSCTTNTETTTTTQNNDPNEIAETTEITTNNNEASDTELETLQIGEHLYLYLGSGITPSQSSHYYQNDQYHAIFKTYSGSDTYDFYYLDQSNTSISSDTYKVNIIKYKFLENGNVYIETSYTRYYLETYTSTTKISEEVKETFMFKNYSNVVIKEV